MACFTIYFNEQSTDRNTNQAMVTEIAKSLIAPVGGKIYQGNDNHVSVEFDDSYWQQMKEICESAESVSSYAPH
jgi:hypothetical protein